MKTLPNITKSAVRLAYSFDEPAPGGRDLLGGKGAGLAEMAALGCRCRRASRSPPRPAAPTWAAAAMPDGLEDEVDERSRALEKRDRQAFGDPTDPLLVSVRSGAASRCPA